MSDFKYTNRNPMGIREEDCVTRAIQFATGESYFKIRKQLGLVADLLECQELCVCCYNFLIEKVYNFPKEDIDRDITAGEFAKQHPKGIYLIRMEGHLSVVSYGIINDTWDCSDLEVTNAWFCGYK